MAILGHFKLPTLVHEPFTSYGPGSDERKKLVQAIDNLKSKGPQIIQPSVNNKPVSKSKTFEQVSPYEHKSVLAVCQQADAETADEAIRGALAAKNKWVTTPLNEKAAIFYRTMLGQGKNPCQADIDCIAESIDFLKTFPVLADELYKNQPGFNAPGIWNRSEQRPLDGFVYAISPFNFTALAVNLVLAPIIVGNVVVWKPSPGAVLSSWLFQKIMMEAGLPAGVLQFLPGDAIEVTNAVLNNKNLGALHFTGSTKVFQSLWSQIGDKISFFTSYPRLIGETSGQNFHLIHGSANVRNAALTTVRAAFEYQGQKCSACSRVYIAKSIASEFLDILVSTTKDLTMGDAVTDFCGPIISGSAFRRVADSITSAKSDPTVEVLEGGQCDDSVGYYVVSEVEHRDSSLYTAPILTYQLLPRPTIVKARDYNSVFLKDEIFGPFLAVYVYPDEQYGPEILGIIDETSDFALSGAVFANDRDALQGAIEGLRFSAGNFYVNDQCTGAMPGHQPFGGSRASGTNDKAGSATLLQRFVSARTIKENFGTIDDVLYVSNHK